MKKELKKNLKNCLGIQKLQLLSGNKSSRGLSTKYVYYGYMFRMCLFCFALLSMSMGMCTTQGEARRKCEVMDMVVGIKLGSLRKATNVINLYRPFLHPERCLILLDLSLRYQEPKRTYQVWVIWMKFTHQPSSPHRELHLGSGPKEPH